MLLLWVSFSSSVCYCYYHCCVVVILLLLFYIHVHDATEDHCPLIDSVYTCGVVMPEALKHSAPALASSATVNRGR